MMADPLYRRLVGQLCVELQEALPGPGLKDLAEFLVDLADEHPVEDRFVEALVECDPDFSAGLAQRVHATIAALRPPDPARATARRLRPSEAAAQPPSTADPAPLLKGEGPTASAESRSSAEAFLQRVLGAESQLRPPTGEAQRREGTAARREATDRKRSRSRSPSADRDRRGGPRRGRGRSPPRQRRRSRSPTGGGRRRSRSGGRRRTRPRRDRSGSRSRSSSASRDSRSRSRRRSRSRSRSKRNGHLPPQSNGRGPPPRPPAANSSPRPLGSAATRSAETSTAPNTSDPSAVELWELAQLTAAGHGPSVGPAAENGHAVEKWRDDLNVDVVMDYHTPKFLVGLVAETGRPPSPLRITRNPDGSLQRAAMQHAERMRERRAQERRAGAGAEPELDELNAVVVPRSRPGLSSQSLQEQRRTLPIFQLRAPLMNAIQEHQVLVVIGETGSGKTTQLTQYLLEEGYAPRGLRIGCTQPRRVAAITVSRRVAQEVGCQCGAAVGYAVRFEDCTSSATKIKYMTDGLLLREALIDRELSMYSAIILDEAHERALNTDVLFGLLKDLTARRPDLKLIVTSATLDAEKFSAYFRHCPIFTIPGRTYPVELLYSRQPEADFVEGVVTAALQVHANEAGKGDILVFLTGQDEIEVACQQLRSQWRAYGQRGETASLPDLLILPIYSALPPELQARIFDPAPANTRKIIVATNIAETSVTIDGVGYVIDSGFVKQKVYDPRLSMESLTVAPISRAAAKQRAGRAGRTGPGKCYRLYTEAAWATEMVPDTVPELCRANLGNVVLTLKAMGIADLLHFDFLDPPAPQGLLEAMATLHGLGALDDDGALTDVGRHMAELPLEPMLARTLLAACALGCPAEVLTITSMLSAGNVFFRPKAKQLEADACKAQFAHPDGDHLTYLSVFRRWERANYASSWCFSNFINFRAMSQAREVRGQLADLLRRFRLPLESTAGDAALIQRAICSGYFLHVAKRAKDGYATLSRANTMVYLHPSSIFFNSPEAPAWLVYHELVLTSREYMRDVVAVNPRWLPEVAPSHFTLRG